MAYLVDYSTVSTATAAANKTITTANIPDHLLNDVIVVAITTGINSASITASGGVVGSSWTQIGATTTSGTLVSAAESCTLTFASDVSQIHIFVLRDVDTTTPIDVQSVAAGTTASQFSNASVTTTTADCFLLYYNALDSTATTPPAFHTAPDGNSHFIDCSDNGGTTQAANIATGCAAWYVQRAIGVTPTPAWNGSLTNVSIRATVAFRNKASGTIPAYIDNSVVIGTKLMDGHWWASATTRNNENFKATPLTVTSIITHLGTLTGTFDAAATALDVGLNPYSPAISSTPGTSATALTGFELGFPTTTINMTTGWIVGTIMESTPKAANFNMGSIATGGCFLSIGKTTNYRIFQILAKDNLVNAEGRAVFSVQANQTQTQSGQSVTAPTIASIDKICFLQRGNTATMATYVCDWHLIQKIIVAGGDAVTPVDSEGVYRIGKFARVKIIQKQGAGGLLALVPLQIGGGDAVNFNIDAGALQFPRIYSRAQKEIHYHGADNAIGISYAGKSGDVISHTNSVVTSASPYYWEINASATSAATWDFSGLVVVKALVTLRPVMTFDSMSFSNCTLVTTTGSTVTNCNFGNSPIAVSSPANAALISSSNITKTSGTSHGITITGTAANCTLSGLIFTGYAASNGSTGNEAIFVNIASGIVNITISGGSTPSIRTAGATVNVVSGAIVTFTGLPIGCDIVILTAGTNTVLQQVDAHATTSYAWGYQGTPTVDVGFINPGYKVQYIRGLVLGSTDSSIPVSMQTDLNYA